VVLWTLATLEREGYCLFVCVESLWEGEILFLNNEICCGVVEFGVGEK
jgi:hypothetical protein